MASYGRVNDDDNERHGQPRPARRPGGTNCILPFQTTVDGDTLWCATTGEVAPVQSFTALAELASETAWDAVLRAVEPETDQQGGA